MKDKHHKLILVIYSLLIAYVQGFVSFIIIYVIFKRLGVTHKYLKNINDLSYFMYGLALIILGSFNIINEFFEKKIRSEISIIGLFMPCSGILSVLATITLLGYEKYLFPATLIMSTGIFTTLLIVSIIIGKTNLKKPDSKLVKLTINTFYIILILVGFKILFFYKF